MDDEVVHVEDILARYNSPEPLGGGGQKLVFTVYNPEIGKIVIKIGRYRSAQTLERIKREVFILSSLNSPYFPRQFDFQVIDAERFLIAEEFLDGHPLTNQFENFALEPNAIGLANELTKGLCDLWSHRVVHRDIKPANIIITATGPKIIDLGIARLLDSTSLTHSLAPFGPCTPNYASPEQLQNRKQEIDHRSDQFNLGIIMAQSLLNGMHPFNPVIVGQGDDIPTNIVAGLWGVEKVKDISGSATFSILCRMLAREPYMRFRLYQEFQQKLSDLMG